MRLLPLGIFVLGLAGACASSQQSAQQSAAAGAEQVCKRMTPTGSSVPQRVCHTRDEWTAMERQGREDVEEFNRARDELTNPNPL